MRINTPIFSLLAQRNLAQTTRALARSMERLASGHRVNSARDDAAGLAIGNGLDAQRRGTLQAIRNINDSKGFLDTADGAISSQVALVQRMRELALQAANGTLSHSDRAYLNSELQEAVAEFDRLANQTEYNGVKLLDGSFGSKNLQVGSKKDQTIRFDLSSTQAADIFSATYEDEDAVVVGDGTFASRVTMAVGAQPTAVATADFNGDGFLDIVSSDEFGGGTASVLLGNGDGTFKSKLSLSVGSNPIFVHTADVNNDGHSDILTADYSSATASILLGNGDGTFKSRKTAQLDGPYSVSTGDLNGDNILDLVGAEYIAGQFISVSLGNGDGTFRARTTISTIVSAIRTQLKDFNGDGNLDVAVAGFFDSQIQIGLGNGDGTFRSFSNYTVGFNNYDLEAADLNNDGKLDLITTDVSDNTASVLLGNGDGTFGARSVLSTGASAYSVNAGDFNGDGITDLATTTSLKVNIHIGNGDGTFSTQSTFSLGAAGYRSTLGDFNEDGVLDLVHATNAENVASLFLGNTTGGAGDITIGVAEMDISTQESAGNVLLMIDNALPALLEKRSHLSAIQSRLEFAANSNSILAENLSSAQSQILDTDYAEEMADFMRLQILQQAGIAVLSQANTSNQIAMELLKNL